ncbi:hydroxyacylglutathione hydrolase [Pseudoalteromonas fenneropenaei]|uniref:Hydroxyacylglutathione hydrolase n=1 Tax=Pseudoalteromonas fenneropenaei TaxID=1737459 RepID=A0ABV7CGD6_9GAMM
MAQDVTLQITPLPAYNDNYIWLVTTAQQNTAYVVDPGDANVVIAALAKRELTLKAILLTHHHWDHTDGVAQLRAAFPECEVYGPADGKFQNISIGLCDGDYIQLFDVPVAVMATPGHTLDHLCYIGDGFAFTGDTLFHGGCGRLFEGSAEQMWHSLQRLNTLPSDTHIYCTHEYTLANLAFASAVEPHNQTLQAEIERVKQLRAHHQVSLPTTLAMQRLVNPFLRAEESAILALCPAQYLGKDNAPWQRFAALRRWKDNF